MAGRPSADAAIEVADLGRRDGAVAPVEVGSVPALDACRRVWLAYLVAVVAVAAVFGRRAADPVQRPDLFVVIHVALGALVVLFPHAVRPTEVRQRLWYGALAICGLPVVFTSLALVLPGVHPRNFAGVWIEWDRWLTGTDPTVAMQTWLAPWGVELLQWCYAAFYFVPMAVIGAIAWRCGGRAFDRALLTVIVAFLSSYLGYLVWPTLPPYLYLDHGEPLTGVWLAAEIRVLLEDAELFRYNCFPSGHTLVSVVSAILAWQVGRVFGAVTTLVAATIVFSTVALRYHFLIDVLAGLVWVPPVFVAVHLLLRGSETGPPSARAASPKGRRTPQSV